MTDPKAQEAPLARIDVAALAPRPLCEDRRAAATPETRPAGRRFEGPSLAADGAPHARRAYAKARRAPLRAALERYGRYGPGQTAGRFYPMACVALEVTQRCNLDCTLCYLSEEAEAAQDPPLDLLLERVAMIASHYGPGATIQLSGGDPTLRPIADLEALCRKIRARGLRACLMTNGIRATRSFLARLAAAGLDDVAFHVDMTQQRRGYASEAVLNALRDQYLRRANGLGLRVLFNTTVFDGNLAEIASLSAWFRDRAEALTLVSFQLQADAGRGVLREREATVSQESVMAAIAEGFAAEMRFDVASVGHERCNRYTAMLVAGDQAVAALSDERLAHEAMAALEALEAPTDAHLDIRRTALRLAARRPVLALRLAAAAARLLWRLRAGLVQTRGRAHRLSVLVHNFMDSTSLENERCETCVFMVATENGPLSMCAHNAERDAHVFAPAQLDRDGETRWWSAATGEATLSPSRPPIPSIPSKRRKGRGAATGCAAKTTSEETSS